VTRLGGNLDVLHLAARLWHRLAIRAKALDVKLEGFPDKTLSPLDGLAGGNAAGQVRHVRRVIARSLLDDDRVARA
jgi:hypothetical protein